MARFNTYGPNTSDRLALVSLDDRRPFRAYWPVRFTQIVGGKRWSLSLCFYRTPKPVLVADEKPKRAASSVDGAGTPEGGA